MAEKKPNEVLFNWKGTKGKAGVRMERTPKGAIRWIIVDEQGNEKTRSKSPTFPELERILGTEGMNQVQKDYNHWKAVRDLPEAEVIKPPDFTKIPDLTETEVKNMLLSAELGALVADDAVFKVYFDYLNDAYKGAIADMGPEIYNQMLQVLQGKANPQALQAVMDRSLSAAKDLATNLTKTELTKLGEQVRAGLAAGKHPFEVAKGLDAVKGLDSVRAKTLQNYREELIKQGLKGEDLDRRVNKMYDALLKERKEVIAQTEMRHATSTANYEIAVARGSKYKVSVSSQDSRVSDVCRSSQAQGPIEIKSNFSSGNLHTPHHVRCRCSVSYFSSDELLEGARERARERTEKTEAALAATKAEG